VAGVSAGLVSTLLMAQAHCDSVVGIPLWVVTQGAVSVFADDAVAIGCQSAVWGLGQSVCLEHPDRWGGLIDLAEVATPRMVEDLYAILACPQVEDQLAIRGDGVRARRLRAAQLPVGGGDRPGACKPLGTVLVTGASGRLGRRIAWWAAGAGADHLVLLSRSAAEHPDMIGLAEELRRAGVSTSLVSVDVTDRLGLAAVVDEVRDRCGRIETVVHAAAAIGFQTASELTAEQFCQEYAAKAVGADNLVELFAAEPPDTFILFSSAAGVWGGARQGCYAAANAHLDALAQQVRARGCSAVSVAWGLWADETGLSREVLDAMQRLGINPLSPDIAFAALQCALEADDTLITVADVSWERFLPAFSARRSYTLFSELGSADEVSEPAGGVSTGAEGLSARLVDLTPDQQLDILTRLVIEATAAVLAHSDPADVDGERSFKDLGIDSLTALELRNSLTGRTGLSLAASLVFDYPTPVTVAEHLVGLLTDTTRAVADPRVSARTDEPVAVVGMACRFPGGV
ncbi:beta-ketoacyl reductase, partial [Mycobacterium simulans]|uniref:beta-ketoacyl reductase n=1 Tax=Mycobacterium simulans TaxID=627089 RepID=UPI00174BB88B